jgi:FkbM family methyltransferase
MGEYAYVTSLNIKTVIDIGAHAGEFARMINGMLPEAAIFSFEPLKDEFQQLQKSMHSAHGFKAFNCAIGNTNGTVEIHRSEYSQSSSLLRMANLHKEAFPESAGESLETVEVKILDEVLNGFELQPEILVKLDVQGYEDKVIEGAQNTISKSRAIIAEVSFRELYEGQALFDSIYQSLKNKGFVYMGNLYQLLNPLDGSPLQADALFVRP